MFTIVLQKKNNCRFFQWDDKEEEFQIEVKFEDEDDTTVEIAPKKKVVVVDDYDSVLLEKLSVLQLNDSSDDDSNY